jgi:E3 ubiquitin-protein ligase HUWE1
MYDDGYGDEMEYEEDMGEDEEDNISEEDEEIEGIGHIEGLPGDHAVDVEVIMEEEDDDDDEDDEDEEDTDDHEHHHGGSDDDEGRVEIIDELEGNRDLGEEDDLEEWESDEGDEDEGDEDEEDYEAQAQDEDEVHIHQGLDVGMVGGPLGDLVRALGGGEGAVDILERMEEQMEAEGLDAGDDDERLGAEYMEDGDGDGKSPFRKTSIMTIANCLQRMKTRKRIWRMRRCS